MIKSKKIIILFLAVIIMIQGLASCQRKGDEVVTLRIGVQTSYSQSIQFIMMLTGSLEEALPENTVVEFVTLVGDSNIRDAIIANELDIAIGNILMFISAIDNDMPLTLLGCSFFSSAIVFSCNEDIRTIDDIGTTDKIAVNSIGAQVYYAFILYCEETYGDAYKYSDNLFALATADMLASMSSSRVPPCGILTFPNTKRAEDIEGFYPILDLTPTMVKNGVGNAFYTSNSFYENNPVLIEIFYKVLNDTIVFMNEQPDEAARLLADFWGDVKAGDIEAQIRSNPPTFEFSESAYDKVAKFMYEIGALSNPPKPFSSLSNYENIPKMP